LALPTVCFVTAPARGGASAGRWIKTLPLDALPDGELRRVALVADHRDAWTLEKQVQLGAAWLLRKGDAVQAWSVTCPHLGCAVDRRASGPGFNCPCHDSSFDADGRRLDGPSPRDLDTLNTQVVDGFVLVDFQRFRIGAAEKAPVG
jgi:cytochrome b6-f complex iron-sulfur subunit/menaquinol-cytochrome c reductase iron-sulfur subunit